jgi:hypothetical protein
MDVWRERGERLHTVFRCQISRPVQNRSMHCWDTVGVSSLWLLGLRSWRKSAKSGLQVIQLQHSPFTACICCFSVWLSALHRIWDWVEINTNWKDFGKNTDRGMPSNHRYWCLLLLEADSDLIHRVGHRRSALDSRLLIYETTKLRLIVSSQLIENNISLQGIQNQVLMYDDHEFWKRESVLLRYQQGDIAFVLRNFDKCHMDPDWTSIICLHASTFFYWVALIGRQTSWHSRICWAALPWASASQGLHFFPKPPFSL